MLIEHIFLGFCGLAAGLAVSAGTFAFLIVIGVIPRMIGKCNRAGGTARAPVGADTDADTGG